MEDEEERVLIFIGRICCLGCLSILGAQKSVTEHKGTNSGPNCEEEDQEEEEAKEEEDMWKLGDDKIFLVKASCLLI
ncbi:hypothetical protein E2C01_094955 [Portunus trituberculatus]|uniref:Uncharacterized protein n=1 Tax=Portunus trituberculatus TaxID=210409 RepID=A0A5B7JY99_PORTR|nr:hypothetical protein [Portunus trituberculatus]